MKVMREASGAAWVSKDAKCRDCIYAVLGYGSYFECRRYPAQRGPSSCPECRQWPLMNADDWCGEFTKAIEE